MCTYCSVRSAKKATIRGDVGRVVGQEVDDRVEGPVPERGRERGVVGDVAGAAR